MEWAALCERYRDGLLGQPADALTSLAFVAAGAGVLLANRRRHDNATVRDQRTVYGLLVAGVGVGSFIQHGPHPDWQAYAHDLPLAAVLVVVTVDAASDLLGRELPRRWWLIPSLLMVPLVAAGPAASTAAQALMASAAVGLNLVRARRCPALRRPVLSALAAAAAGSAISTLTDRASLCRPDSLLQGHAAWHLLAATALWLLTPAVGARRSGPAVVTPTEPKASTERTLPAVADGSRSDRSRDGRHT